MTGGGVPSPVTTLLTLARVTLLRLVRGRSLWVSVLIAVLPLLLAGVSGGRATEAVLAVQFLVLVLLPPMFVSSSLGEEIEDRTTTYLWSRPIARWTIIVGKLLALIPVALVLVVSGAVAALQLTKSGVSIGTVALAFTAGTLTVAALSAGIATLVPRHGMALTIVYMVVFDLALGAIPASINRTSVTHQVALMLDGSVGAPVITLAILSAVWLGVALWRIRRLES